MWTKDKPEASGFYWWRESADEDPEVVEFYNGETYRAGAFISAEQAELTGEWLPQRLEVPES